MLLQEGNGDGMTSHTKEMLRRLWLPALVCIAVSMHFVRIFDDTLWFDELQTVTAALKNGRDMLWTVAGWGHVPLYYLLVWFVNRIFGLSGEILHLTALVPYMGILLLAVTVVRRRFGTSAAVVLLMLSTLLDSAVRYDVEVRMYALCELFILLAYLAAYRAFTERSAGSLLCMTVWSLLAVYSHSFALIFAGLLYGCLCIYWLAVDARHVWQPILSGLAVLALFAPWLLYNREVNGRAVALYTGLTGLPLKDCLRYIFSSKYSFILLGAFGVIFVLAVLYDLGIAELRPSAGARGGVKAQRLVLKPGPVHFQPELLWMLSGAAAVFGEIAAARLFEILVYPILTERYLYPSFVVIWLLFGVAIGKCHYRRVLTLCLSVFLVVTGLPFYFQTVKEERRDYRDQTQTLAATAQIGEGDQILTDVPLLIYHAIPLYYPGAASSEQGGDVIVVPEGCNWLFLKEELPEGFVGQMAEQGYAAQAVVENGYVGGSRVWIYKLVNR